MDLEQWFAHPPSVAALAEGDETDWLDLATIEVATGKLAASDPVRYPLGAVVAGGLRPDAYEIQAKVRARGGARPISRTRALRTGIASCERGRQLGVVAVEGWLGIADDELIAEATDGVSEELLVATFRERGLVTLGRAMVALVAAPGGEHVVFELLHGDRRVGVEVELA